MAGAEISPIEPRRGTFIQRYGTAGFVVGGARMAPPLIVLPEHILAWSARSPETLVATDFDLLVPHADGIDMLLMGCGARGVRLSAEVRRTLAALGITCETMATGAACRTYNVLLAEERRVAAALFAP